MRYPSHELEQASLRARQHLHRELQDYLGHVVAGGRAQTPALHLGIWRRQLHV